MREIPSMPFSQKSPLQALTIPEIPWSAVPDTLWTDMKCPWSRCAKPSSPPHPDVISTRENRQHVTNRETLRRTEELHRLAAEPSNATPRIAEPKRAIFVGYLDDGRASG